MTLASEVGNQVRAVAAVVARQRLTLVDLVFAQLPVVAAQALTRVEADVIDARRVVLALALQALVDVLRAVVLLVAERAVARIILGGIAALAAVLAVLLEAQDATFLRLRRVQAEVRARRQIVRFKFRMCEERKQQPTDPRLSDAAFERRAVRVESLENRVGLRLVHAAEGDRILAGEKIFEGLHVDLGGDGRLVVGHFPSLPARLEFVLGDAHVQDMPAEVRWVVLSEAVRLGQVRRESPVDRHLILVRCDLEVHVLLVLHVKQGPAGLRPVSDLDGLLERRRLLLLVGRLRNVIILKVMILGAFERHVGDAVVAVVEVDALRLPGAFVELAELNSFAVLPFVSPRALAADVVPCVTANRVVLARLRSAEVVRHLALQHRLVVDRNPPERRGQNQIFLRVERVKFDHHRVRAVGHLDVLNDSFEVTFLVRLHVSQSRRPAKVQNLSVQLSGGGQRLAEVFGSVKLHLHERRVPDDFDQVVVAIVELFPADSVSFGRAVEAHVDVELAFRERRGDRSLLAVRMVRIGTEIEDLPNLLPRPDEHGNVQHGPNRTFRNLTDVHQHRRLRHILVTEGRCRDAVLARRPQVRTLASAGERVPEIRAVSVGVARIRRALLLPPTADVDLR